MYRRPRFSTTAILSLVLAASIGGPQADSIPEGEGERRASPGPSPADRCEELAATLGSSPTATGEVCRVTFPRADLEVRLGGATLPPGMGLTSWAAFGRAGDRGAIVMGDLALTDDELPEVMAGLRENGIRVTAVHRHMLGESPTISFMHYLGVGPADSLARGLRAAMERAPTSRGAAREDVSGPPEAARTGGPGEVAGVACDRLTQTLGTDPADAATGAGYCKVSRPRTDLDVRVDGIPVPASLGVGSWFAFRETASGDSAVVTGDMALTQEQVNSAIRALREADIGVVALHNHMLHDEPRVMFFHFQAKGAPGELAEGLRTGLEAAGLVAGR